MKLVGGKDLAAKLRSMPEAVGKRTQLKALKVGAEPIRSAMAENAPRDSEADAPHLADNIIVGDRSLTKGAEGEVIVEVGPAKHPSDHFYGFFQEYGTAFIPAQAFARPGFDTGAGRGLNLILAELWAAIRKHAGKGGGTSTTGRGL